MAGEPAFASYLIDGHLIVHEHVGSLLQTEDADEDVGSDTITRFHLARQVHTAHTYLLTELHDRKAGVDIF